MGPLEVVQLIAAPPIQDWSFTGRWAAHTAIWASILMVQQYLVLGLINLLRKVHLQQSARAPSLSQAVMFYEVTMGYIGWAWPTGLYAAWLNPGAPDSFSWDYGPPSVFLLMYFCLFTLLGYDAYSYFLHRWLHLNKTAFVWLHAKHHEHKAALDTRSAGYMSILEGLFSDALPMLCIYALGQQLTGNWWMSFVGVWHAFHIVHVGHCGHDVTLTHAGDIPILLLNPFALGFLGCPARATPKEHEDHHTYPRKNFAYFSTYWDTLKGTDQKGEPHTTLLLCACAFLWSYMVFVNQLLAAWHAVPFITSYLLFYVAVSPATAAAIADAVGLPEATRRCFGWLMDWYRRDVYITYAQPGQPGAFEPAAAVVTAAAAHDEDDGADDTAPVKDQDTKHRAAAPAPAAAPAASGGAAPVYLFACHPTGLLSRAALQTFGARGWDSPVSGLPKVRFAVASLLFRLPYFFMREFILAIGCIPAERGYMKRVLQAGTSVAVTPGGWREADHLQTYNLVLKRRQGFVQLAAETGAHLVPVLCLGEQDLVGAPEPGFKLIKWVVPPRPMPLHVVFGEPVVPRPEESVSQLHSRYTASLLALGKQHNVQLAIVD